jgi:hypothetical protein
MGGMDEALRKHAFRKRNPSIVEQKRRRLRDRRAEDMAAALKEDYPDAYALVPQTVLTRYCQVATLSSELRNAIAMTGGLVTSDGPNPYIDKFLASTKAEVNLARLMLHINESNRQAQPAIDIVVGAAAFARRDDDKDE